MRALPGSSSRSRLSEAPQVTRESAALEQPRRIVRATGELVGKRGYGDVTVELIVKRARVSYKTFYKHFPNKEACFVALFEGFTGEAHERISMTLAAGPATPWPEQVVVALRALFAFILEDPVIARACLVEGLTVSRGIVSRYERALSALSPLFRLGREFNAEAADLPDTLEDTLAGGVLWIPFQHLMIGEADRIEALMPEAVQFVLRPYIGDLEAARWASRSTDQVGVPVSATP